MPAIVFLTNELTLAPGLIAPLYKLRWDIEKAFDETKNRFWERKSWASSPTAQTTHARLVWVAYNLTLLLEHKLESEEGIRNEPEHRRKAKERAKINDRGAPPGGRLPAWFEILQRLTQRGVKLIRWVSDHLFIHRPWPPALLTLRKNYRRL